MPTLKKSIAFITPFAVYTASEILGQGGAGVVYGAVDEAGNRVAIKALNPTTATREKLKRFKNEYAFGSSSAHDNIIKVTDFGIYEKAGKSSPFFVMPRYEGSLRGLMTAGLPNERKLRVFGKILDGVEAAHLAGVFHRDLKPENILQRSGGDEVVVADFGIAQFTEGEIYTAVETAASTRLANFLYAAPEQRVPGKEVDRRSDLYALGLMLNEMFTGSVPHGTEYRRIGDSDPNLSYLDTIVEQMLRQSRSHRPQTVEAVKNMLIGHRNEFIARQELDAARRKVVPAGTAFGPLYDNPPKITAVDWDAGRLTLKFDTTLTQEWVNALNNMGSYRSVMGAEPARFRISGDTAAIGADEHDAQRIIDQFKEWIPRAHSVYRMALETARRRAEDDHRERLRREVEAAEKKARVLGSLRI